MTDKKKLIARSFSKLTCLYDGKVTHYIPKSISDNPNFPLKSGEPTVVELYDGYIVIRPKGKDDE